MKIAQADQNLNPSDASEAHGKRKRRFGIALFTAVAMVLTLGPSGTTGCTRGEEIGSTVGITAAVALIVVVAVEVHNGHHTLRGCISNGPNGLELRTSDARMFALDGGGGALKAGDLMKLHGSKLRRTKNANGDGVFRVESVKKDYGTCPVNPTP